MGGVIRPLPQFTELQGRRCRPVTQSSISLGWLQCACPTRSPDARVGETILGGLQMGLSGGGGAWVVGVEFHVVFGQWIRFSHLIRYSRPSWTMPRVQGMFFSGFRLSGAYFEILLQPKFDAYPVLTPELQSVHLRVRLSLLSLLFLHHSSGLLLRYLIVC